MWYLRTHTKSFLFTFSFNFYTWFSFESIFKHRWKPNFNIFVAFIYFHRHPQVKRWFILIDAAKTPVYFDDVSSRQNATFCRNIVFFWFPAKTPTYLSYVRVIDAGFVKKSVKSDWPIVVKISNVPTQFNVCTFCCKFNKK